MIEQFTSEVDEGLSRPQKTLPSKYFYNEKGNELFIEIMRMPEYYLTRSEMEIFSEQTHAIIDALALDPSKYFELIELGAGNGVKTLKLLKTLCAEGYQYDYIPIDISKHGLDRLERSLAKVLPQVSVCPKHGDYFRILESLRDSHHPKVLLFLGSNIGNMPDEVASEFIYQLGTNLSVGDKLLMGADLIKSVEVILPAYNDENGITRDFNLNLLHRINEELGGDFDLKSFEHTPEYNEQEGIAKSYLISTCDQDVTITATGKCYPFPAGEKIQTEISRKYNDEILSKLLSKTDFEIIEKLTDKKGYFADYILDRTASTKR